MMGREHSESGITVVNPQVATGGGEMIRTFERQFRNQLNGPGLTAIAQE